MDEAGGGERLGRQQLAGEHQPARHRLPDLARQPHAGAARRDQPVADVPVPDERPFSCHYHVACQRQFEAAGHDVAVHGGNYRLGGLLDAGEAFGDLGEEGTWVTAIAGERVQVLEVRAGAEARARPGDHDDRRVRVGYSGRDRPAQGSDKGRVERVAPFGPVERQPADVVALAGEQECVPGGGARGGGRGCGHGLTGPGSAWCCSRRTYRWILPLGVLGSAGRKWTARG